MRPNLVHCSYHKCLTVYFRRVMDAVFNRCLPWSGGYRHFNSDIDAFVDGFASCRVATVNNRVPDLERLGEFRLTRFIRDPRDLVVSGYFYHRRGAEPWCTMENPSDEDWEFANGSVPLGLREAGGSFAVHLQSLSEEDGLLAELEFRRPHFESMTGWPESHPDILLFRYEDVLGREVEVFGEIFDHYGLTWLERRLGLFFAERHSLARRRAPDPHIRNPTSGQWRSRFTPRVKEAFDAEWADLVERLGYPPD
ncbi:MAG: hypothetical protein V2I67_01600 [Thermoanaerobaculales bacterium]|jgi:hypothetical protein|nr:hypothetical protein [Thermoanaerobaculales bacterium]